MNFLIWRISTPGRDHNIISHKMQRALFIGRFQPFHLGHLSVIKKAIKEVDQLIIGIGSAEENYLPENPFTAGERFEMIDAALEDAGINPKKYRIIPVRNVNNYALWCDHVDILVPKYEKVYTGSKIVKRLFKKQGKHEIVDVKKELNICSTKVREEMKNSGKWKKMVPKKVAELIDKWQGTERLKKIL